MLMDSAAYFVGGAVLLLAVTHVVVGGCYTFRLSRHRRGDVDSEDEPKAAVILALRGSDPFLDRTLCGLMKQRYADYTVFLVVDSEADAAMVDIRRILDELQPENFTVQVLEDHKPSCSLKCSALVQAVERLADDFEVVAFIDADAPPHPNWLSDLVSPLKDRSVGVVTGNRWFAPQDVRWGSMVRCIWNAAAIVQVWLNHIVWAGSMAMRTEVARDRELLDGWGRALSVDATVTRWMKEQRLKVHFTPAVMMINEEGIGLAQFQRWVQRQLIAAKSSGSMGILVWLHTFSLSAVHLAAVLLLVQSAFAGHTAVALWLTISLATYWLTSLLSLLLLEAAVSSVARENSVSKGPMTWGIAIRLLPAMALTQAVYTYAFCRAIFRKQIDWRGIEYRINGVNDVQMTEYHPYTQAADPKAADSVV